MSLTIEIAPEKEIKLETEARRKGISADEFAKILIEQLLDSFEPDERFSPAEPKILGTADMRDFSGDDQWLQENAVKYVGQYIALCGNKLIASGKSFKEAANAARRAGVKDAFVTFVEDPESPLFVNV